MTTIRAARFPDDLDLVRCLFREYADGLGVDLGFQDFSAELAQLPGKYGAPGGAVLIAQAADTVLGCVAMRPIDAQCCEMKRLFVRPAGRGQGMGAALARAICVAARAAGYHRMRLDTLPTMHAAQALYASMGFREIPAYVFNPVAGARFLELDLAAVAR